MNPPLPSSAPAPARDALDEVRAAVRSAHARREPVGPLDFSRLDQVVDYQPADMTVTVEAGLTLAALQARLAQHGQWLPLDPSAPARTTIGELLDRNLSGPRRFGYGTVREHLLGLEVVLADGRLIRNGGRVVKNVAGYDLLKLFVCAQGTLGVIIRATFKVRPLPEVEQVVSVGCRSLAEAGERTAAVLGSQLCPVALDLHNLAADAASVATLVLGFAGTREEVEWQVATAATILPTQPANLEHDCRFWEASGAGPVHRRSSLPSRLPGLVAELDAASFVARAGNGVLYYRGGALPPKPPLPLALLRRLKSAFDPHGVLPELPL